MLSIEKLTRRFDEKVAVSGIDFTIESGSFTGIIGRSGAGKSTLLRMINRLIPPSEGRVVFDGVDVTKLRGPALLDWRMKCAMIFQQFNLIGRVDVFTNVMMGRLNHMPAWRSPRCAGETRNRCRLCRRHRRAAERPSSYRLLQPRVILPRLCHRS